MPGCAALFANNLGQEKLVHRWMMGGAALPANDLGWEKIVHRWMMGAADLFVNNFGKGEASAKVNDGWCSSIYQ